MGKSVKKKRVRWDRVFIMLFVVCAVLISGTWLFNKVFDKSKKTQTQTQTQIISTESNTQSGTKYKQPVKGPDGVYRVEDTIIVNKKYGLSRAYNPGENQEAVSRLKQMLGVMLQQNLKVMSGYDGYRSYEVQEKLYNQYVLEHGQTEADTFSARPGFSEHQTGLAFDLVDQSGELLQLKNNAQAVQWLRYHAHEYGFIVRYLEDKEAITGYIHEEWHVRYVGEELAKKMYESKLSLEEYYSIEGGSYK